VHNFSRVSRSPGGAKVPDDIFHDLCSKSSAVAEMGDRGHNRHEPKSGKVLCPFRGGVGSPCNTMWPGRGLPRAKWHLDPCSCLATIHWPILGVVSPPPFFVGERGPHLTMPPGPRSTSVPHGILIHLAVWPQHGEGSWVGPHLTIWAGPRPSCLQSFILMHSTVWPQYANVTDRTDRQTTV